MIVRYLEQCPNCGQWDPWRTYSKKVSGLEGCEVARRYVKCRRCGMTEVVSVRRKSGFLPESVKNR